MHCTQEVRVAVTVAAEAVRQEYSKGRDAVLGGHFDRFIEALARMLAADIVDQYGSDPDTSVEEMGRWFSRSGRDRAARIWPDAFGMMCSAHGIPQSIIIDHDVSGSGLCTEIYSREVFALLGWVATP